MKFSLIPLGIEYIIRSFPNHLQSMQGFMGTKTRELDWGIGLIVDSIIGYFHFTSLRILWNFDWNSPFGFWLPSFFAFCRFLWRFDNVPQVIVLTAQIDFVKSLKTQTGQKDDQQGLELAETHSSRDFEANSVFTVHKWLVCVRARVRNCIGNFFFACTQYWSCYNFNRIFVSSWFDSHFIIIIF